MAKRLSFLLLLRGAGVEKHGDFVGVLIGDGEIERAVLVKPADGSGDRSLAD